MGELVVTIDPKEELITGRVSGAHPLSNLDHMMRLHNVRLVYYYKNVTKTPYSKLIQAFKDKFKVVLNSYPPVCGRLHKRDEGNWEIKCNNAGVKVLKATVNLTLEDWLQIADRSAELKLCTWRDLNTNHLDDSPLVYVQFNAFKGDGLAIGISCGHMLADPSCLTHIMKVCWQTRCGVAVPVSHKPSFVQPGVLKARDNKNNETKATLYYKNFKIKPHDGRSSEFKTETFKFTHDYVKEFISQIKSNKHKNEELTPFEALSALFWAAFVRAKNQPGATLSICTEFRTKLHPPQDYGLFGNVLHFSEVIMSMEDHTNLSKDLTNLSKDDLSAYLTHLWGPAKEIQGDILRLETEEFRSVIDWLEKKENKEVERHLYGPHLTAINGENFLTYESKFETGEKPQHVSYYVEPMLGDGLIFVLPSAEGNLSRTVMLTLPKHQADSACEYLAKFKFRPCTREDEMKFLCCNVFMGIND